MMTDRKITLLKEYLLSVLLRRSGRAHKMEHRMAASDRFQKGSCDRERSTGGGGLTVDGQGMSKTLRTVRHLSEQKPICWGCLGWWRLPGQTAREEETDRSAGTQLDCHELRFT